jgi:hypothetical protein
MDECPSPPSPTLTRSVHGYTTPCVCARYGAYAVRAGIEPTSAAFALTDRHFPAGGSHSPLVTGGAAPGSNSGNHLHLAIVSGVLAYVHGPLPGRASSEPPLPESARGFQMPANRAAAAAPTVHSPGRWASRCVPAPGYADKRMPAHQFRIRQPREVRQRRAVTLFDSR